MKLVSLHELRGVKLVKLFLWNILSQQQLLHLPVSVGAAAKQARGSGESQCAEGLHLHMHSQTHFS